MRVALEMLCFCSATTVRLPTLTPTASLNIRAVSSPLKDLLSLLGLENVNMRMDEHLSVSGVSTNGIFVDLKRKGFWHMVTTKEWR